MDPVSLIVGLLLGALVAAVLLVVGTLGLIGGFLHFLSREEDTEFADEIGDTFPHSLDPITP